MQGTTPLGLAAVILLLAASPTFAGPCKSSIDDLQGRVDSAIEHKAGADPWKPESVNALRDRQPTPRSIAASEGAAGKKFKHVLMLLKRARSADRAGNSDRCNAALSEAWSAFDAL